MPMNNKEDHLNRCLECGDRIRYGRTDRKFCCDKCKNSYNNRKTRVSRNFKLKVRNAIEKNYEILESLVKSELSSISLSEIAMMGFKVDFVTSYHKVGSHHEYWCYDIRYYLSDSRLFEIQRVVPFNRKECVCQK